MEVRPPENIFKLGRETEQEGFAFEDLEAALNYQNDLIKYETDADGNVTGIKAESVFKLIDNPLSDEFISKYPDAYEMITSPATVDLWEKEAFIIDDQTYTIDEMMDEDSVLTAMLDHWQAYLNHGVASSDAKSGRDTKFKNAAIARTNILAYYHWTIQNDTSGQQRGLGG